MIKKHWDGVIKAATSTVTNARAEAINSRVQWVKRMARGFGNRENFRSAIYFHLGCLDLHPEALEKPTRKREAAVKLSRALLGLSLGKICTQRFVY